MKMLRKNRSAYSVIHCRFRSIFHVPGELEEGSSSLSIPFLSVSEIESLFCSLSINTLIIPGEPEKVPTFETS